MTVIFKDTSVEESDKAKSGIIIDYDSQGAIVSIEILDAQKRITQRPRLSTSLRSRAPHQAIKVNSNPLNLTGVSLNF